MLILFISVVIVIKNIEPLLHFLDVVYNICIYREKTRVTKKNGTFPRIESVGFQDLFFYTLPLYYNSLLYRQFTVRARYVGRNQSFTGFQK